MPIRQLYEIVGGVSNSWIKSMRDGEKAANDLRDATGMAGDSMDDMGDSAQGASGIFGRFTSSLSGAKGALIGIGAAIGGAVAAFALLANSAREALNEMQELIIFTPEWDLSGISRLQDSLTALGLSEQNIDRVFDSIGEGALRVAEGQFALDASFAQMVSNLQTAPDTAGMVFESLRAEYFRLSDLYGSGEARRRFDESFGGTGSEGLFTLFGFTDEGEVESAFNRFTGYSESQLQAMKEATQAAAQFGLAMDTLRAQITLTLAPVFRAVAGFAEWYYNAGVLADFIKYGVIGALGILGIAVVGLTIKVAILGVSMFAAFFPIIAIVGAVALGIGAIAVVIANWESIWNGIGNAMKAVWDFLKGIVDLLKQAIGYAKDFYESPAFYLVPGVGQAKLAGDIGGGIASGVGSAASFVTNSFSSAPSTSTTTNRSSNVTINVTSESEESLADTVREGLEESEERSI